MKKRAEVDAKKQADIDANRQKMKAEAAKKAEEQAKKPSADELYGNVPLNKEFVRERSLLPPPPRRRSLNQPSLNKRPTPIFLFRGR